MIGRTKVPLQIALIAGLLVVTAAAAALAHPVSHRCSPLGVMSQTTVAGMTCHNGLALIAKLFNTTDANQLPPYEIRYFKVAGWAGRGNVRRRRVFNCRVEYTDDTGTNRGGVLLQVSCSDSAGATAKLRDHQDGE